MTAQPLGEMTEQSLVLPTTGEIVNLDDESSCAQALDDVRQAEKVLRDIKTRLVDAIVARSELLGSRTLDIAGGRKAVIRSGISTEYDAEEIEQELRAAGMPEERIREIVQERVSYAVVAVEAKRAAGASTAYRYIIERHSRPVTKPPSVSIERR